MTAGARPGPVPPMLSVRQVAALTGVSETTVRHAEREAGEILGVPFRRIGTRILVPAARLAAELGIGLDVVAEVLAIECPPHRRETAADRMRAHAETLKARAS